MLLSSKSTIPFKSVIWLFLVFICFLYSAQARTLYVSKLDDLYNFIGHQDAVLVADPQGRIIISKNASSQLVPASTIKILTALSALHYLGPNYRFVTEFYHDQDSNLKVKGYGDPLLISETLVEIANDITNRLDPKLNEINDLVLDDSYFRAPIIIPGVKSSYEPYDAPNGALCVNFNTVNFKRNQNGAYVSAELETPLLPFVLTRIKASTMDQGRIILSHKKNESTLYAGHLLLYFLKKEGIKSNGIIRIGKINKKFDKPIYRYISSFSLVQVVSKLLEHSNNFMANQLLIAVGSNVYGSPGTLDKGVHATETYVRQVLNTEDIHLVEGSGISRANRISAKTLHAILENFKPYHQLMQKKAGLFLKPEP